MSELSMFVAPTTSISMSPPRIHGTISELMGLASIVSRSYGYFVIEKAHGGVRIRFSNDNPAAEQEVDG